MLLLISDRSSVLLKQLRGSKVAMVRPCFSPSVFRTLKQAVLRAMRMSRLILGRSVRLRQCKVFSSLTSDAVILSSVASDTGAMFAGRGSTGAGMTVLVFHGCLIDSGRSRDCSLVLGSAWLPAGLSALTLAHTRFLVDRFGGS